MPRQITFENPLTWEDSYAIAQALSKTHLDVQLEDVSLLDIYHWTIALPQFDDELELANDSILTAIFQEWFEEVG
jgi:FeS assembly protein IscX